MVSKNVKMLLLAGGVIVGGYFLYSAITGNKLFGTYQGRFTRNQIHAPVPPLGLYPSMAPVGGPYPSPSPFHTVTVF